MARKIFVSYKYGDTKVKALTDSYYDDTKVRDYVTKLQEVLDYNNHIYKGENDGEDLSNFKDSTIESKLRKKIFDSSITIVMVSSGMKDNFISEKDQWIPWEISYSLKELWKDGRKSLPNGVLMVVLPDEHNSYNYYIQEHTCTDCNCQILNTSFLFKILKENVFNSKELTKSTCKYYSNNPIYSGDHSYIISVKWNKFITDTNYYLNWCAKLRENIDQFNISKMINC